MRKKAHDCSCPQWAMQSKRNKDLEWFVWLSAGEMPPDLMIGSSFEAYSISCQGSTLCPKQFSKSQPKIITLMWQLTAIISSDLLRCTQKWKTHTHFLFHLQRFYSRNKIITRMLNHLHSWGCTQVICSIHVAECHKCGSFQIVLLAARSGVSTQLSGTHELIIFFFKTRCWKALWPEGSLVCCGVCGEKYHTLASPVPAPLWFVHSVWSSCDLKHYPNSLRGYSLASVPGMLNPVSNHPLLTGASLDHQAKAKVGVFGHFYLQTSASVPADDWTVLYQIHIKITVSWNSSLDTKNRWLPH